jgi:hypothetical protein
MFRDRPLAAMLAAIAIAVGTTACNRAPDQSAAAKPELTPTAPAIGAPPASPAPVMPPKAARVFEPSAAGPESQPSSSGPAAQSGTEKTAGAETAKGDDPNAKEPMSQREESSAMPKPAQANDHSTLATDGKQ